MDELPESDIPTNVRPDLSNFGIVEYDRGICADTAENRAMLRSHKMGWRAIFNKDGLTEDLIEAISPEMLAASTSGALADRAPIMEDPADKNSDYVTGIHLILTHEAEEIAPHWVIAACREWHNWDLHPELPRDKRLNGPPQRCLFIKQDGIRCLHWASGRRDNEGHCRTHMRSTGRGEGPGMAIIRARNRLIQETMATVDALVAMRDDPEASPAVRTRAMENILDRAGLRAGIDIDVTAVMGKPADQILRERLDKFRTNAAELEALSNMDENTVDAEIVEDDEVPVQPYGRGYSTPSTKTFVDPDDDND